MGVVRQNPHGFGIFTPTPGKAMSVWHSRSVAFGSKCIPPGEVCKQNDHHGNDLRGRQVRRISNDGNGGSGSHSLAKAMKKEWADE
jgi:hypothetical protein